MESYELDFKNIIVLICGAKIAVNICTLLRK